MWKLLHDVVRTGEHWMENSLCPRCRIPQKAEHLFLTCPLALELWSYAEYRWMKMTVEKFWRPRTWGEVLFATRLVKGSAPYMRRWWVFFSTVLWTLWAQRCAWSFGEIRTFEWEGIKKYFKNTIAL
ncbi:hypothetical protein BDZ91DRAFT_745217 [Kalaharituber pfeilii]|nr:hypothetical protein BDZ91DRAFT_745217 [Kalaharituber pfeilii]